MKRVINGKMYDTNTANEIAETIEYDNGTPKIWRTLYRKKNGEFFLHKEEHAFNDIYNSIKPITENEAKEFAEKHLDGDGYEAIFGHVDE